MVEVKTATKRYEDLEDCATTTAVPGDAERYARAVQGSPSYGDLGRVTGAHSKLGVGDLGPAIFPRLSSCVDDSNIEDHSGEESGETKGKSSYVCGQGDGRLGQGDPVGPGPGISPSLAVGQGGGGSLAVGCNRNKKAKKGRYQLLAPWRDQDGVWRVGGRNRLTAPFTADGKPAILLPEGSKYTYLAMLAVHNKAHPGVQQTVVQYRQDDLVVCEGWDTCEEYQAEVCQVSIPRHSSHEPDHGAASYGVQPGTKCMETC